MLARRGADDAEQIDGVVVRSEAAPALSVVIVTWNSAEVIGACLRTLADSAIPGGAEIIVVDNASQDNTAAQVARDCPEARVIRSPVNLGFAAANNRAIAMARGDLLLLLNPDVVLSDPTAIARMMEAMASHLSVGMTGCRLVFPGGRHQVGDAGFRPTTSGLIVHGLGLSRVLPSLPAVYLTRPDSIADETRDVDWICGACLLVRRTVIEAVGGLDERMFLYAEDVEWGCRARAAGFRVLYLPQVRVTHLQGRSEVQAVGATVSVRWLTALLDLHVRLNGNRRLPLVRVALAAGFAVRGALLVFVAQATRARALWAYADAAWRYAEPPAQ